MMAYILRTESEVNTMKKLGILLIISLFAFGSTAAFAQYSQNNSDYDQERHEESNESMLHEQYMQSGQRFSTDLNGAEEVPPVDTDMYGRFRITFRDDGTAAFKLRVKNGEKVTMAHLHCGARGENGPPVVHLLGEIPGGFDMDKTVASFSIHDGNITPEGESCDPQITDVSSLYNAIIAGEVYANVHTVDHPNGEIRGQLGD
jgi:hypothetical protein